MDTETTATQLTVEDGENTITGTIDGAPVVLTAGAFRVGEYTLRTEVVRAWLKVLDRKADADEALDALRGGFYI